MLVDVSVPEIGMDSLTYRTDRELRAGLRVIVEVKSTKYTGFIVGQTAKKLPVSIEIKPVEGVIDEEPVVDVDIWDLAVWAANVSMCGMSSALKAALPQSVYTGEKISPSPFVEASGNFTERHCFNPLDSERVKFFLTELKENVPTLILFPKRDEAKSFFLNLPDGLKQEALLWPETPEKLREAWKKIHSGEVRIVTAPPGGVFAPLRPRKIIVEDESSPFHAIPYTMNLSARSLAGHRAVYLKSELILAGRVPSLKTYIRSKPREVLKPDRKNIILADIHQSRKESLNGIEGTILLTNTLTSRTHKQTASGRNVLWLLNRTGESSEVFCENCGESITCPKCGSVMQSRNDGNILRCRRCGNLREVPSKCEKCGYPFLQGKRPGLEALAKIAGKYFPDVHIFTEGSDVSTMKGLILSTSKGLELCGTVNPSLVAWLDLDSEIWLNDYTRRFNVFRNLIESYWRGRENDPERKLLIQSRQKGMKLAEFLSRGWNAFILDEIRTRRDFLLPPFGYIIEVECSSKILREELINLFMNDGIFVMDSGVDSEPLYVNSQSLESVKKILSSKIFLRNTKKNYINITVRSD